MAKKGTFLVPTSAIDAYFRHREAESQNQLKGGVQVSKKSHFVFNYTTEQPE